MKPQPSSLPLTFAAMAVGVPLGLFDFALRMIRRKRGR